MTIILVGLNHRTAPVELREKLALPDGVLQNTLAGLHRPDDFQTNTQVIAELVILSTCNRLEVYAATEQPDEAFQLIEQTLSKLPDISHQELREHLYRYRDEEAIAHLMKVACGLDSLILGETQILGQVTEALEKAQQVSVTGAILSHLFAQAIHTGKRARAETPISRHTTSVSHAAARLLIDRIEQPQTGKILIVGAGEMAKLAVQALQHFDISDITFINRTYSNAQALASDLGVKAVDWYQLKEALVWADAVICATGAPHIVIYQRDLEAVLSERQARPLTIVDIAVPRDVESTVGTLSGVHYFDIDDLQSIVDGNMELRSAAIPQVEGIIQQEAARFAEWYHAREVTPTIKDLREWAQGIADDELLHALNRLADSDEHTRQVVSLMAHRLVNRLLHEPTSRLRIQANEGNGYGYAHAVRELFALDEGQGLECRHEPGRCDGTPSTQQFSTPCTLQCIMPSVLE